MKWIAKIIFVVAIFSILGAAIGGLASQRSYVLLSLGNTVLETSVWFAVLAIVTVLLVFGVGTFLLFKGVSSGRYFLNWRQERRLQAAIKQTKEGFLQLAQGSWANAESLLKVSFANDSHSLLGYLGAARAANEQGKNDARDAYLQRAKDLNPDAVLAITTSRASMQLERGQYKQVIDTLLELESPAAHNPYVLSLLQRAYIAIHDWSALRSLLPVLRQHQVLDTDTLNRLEKTVYCELMASVGSKRLPDEDVAPYVNDLIRLWEDASILLQANASLLCAYARALVALGEADQAIKLLAREMPQIWSDEAIALYGQIEGSKPLTQLEKAESWLATYANNEELLLALGRIALAANLFDKSKHYLEKSLEIRKSAAAYAALGRVYSALGDDKAANQAFMVSLELGK